MATDLTKKEPVSDILIHDILVAGDVSRLTASQRTEYYLRTCESLGLNPITKPFDFIKLQGKEVLYAKKDATEQLRKINGVSVDSMDSKTVNDIYIVTVKIHDITGRTDMATGAICVKGLTGNDMANAIMKCESKAKRRATLSICGLGILDETELDAVSNIPEIEHPVEKPHGNIDAALEYISKCNTPSTIESAKKKCSLNSWTEEEELRLDAALKAQAQQVQEGE